MRNIIKQILKEEVDSKSDLDQFNNLTIVETGDITYYLDEDRTTIFYIESGRDKININPRKVWDFYWVGMKYSYNEIRNIMMNWLKEKHGITGLTPFIGHEYYSNRFK